MQGWIKLHRKLLDNPIFNDPHLLKLWIYCLLKATHSERKQIIGKQIVELKPGQFVTGRFSLAKEYNRDAKPKDVVSDRTLWRWMKFLEESEFLSIKSTTKYSVVTINNWDKYQDNVQQTSSKCPSNVQQVSTNKNDKNEENINVVVDIDPDGFYERALKQKYMQLGAVRGIDLPPSDINAIHQVIASGVPIHKALELLEECFANYKPKHPRDKINSFSYCATYILNRYFQEKEGANSDQNNRRSTSRTTKQNTKPKEEPIFGDYVGRLPRRNRVPVP